MVKDYSFNRLAYFKVLPLVYDDALSYMETLAQFAKKLNEVVDAINDVTTDAVEQSKAYTDQQITEKMAGIDDKIAEVNRIINELEIANEQFRQTVNARLVFTDNKVAGIQTQLEADIKAVNQRTDLAIEQNNEYILNELPKFLSQIKVVNYFTGELIGVQDMFDYLAQFHLENAINYEELADRDRTYTELAGYNMTYTQLALNGGSIII